jgi:hypothetical protein
LAESTEFKNFEAHDHDSLMNYVSSTYKNPIVGLDKRTNKESLHYDMDKDVVLVEGILRSNHEIN